MILSDKHYQDACQPIVVSKSWKIIGKKKYDFVKYFKSLFNQQRFDIVIKTMVVKLTIKVSNRGNVQFCVGSD